MCRYYATLRYAACLTSVLRCFTASVPEGEPDLEGCVRACAGRREGERVMGAPGGKRKGWDGMGDEGGCRGGMREG